MQLRTWIFILFVMMFVAGSKVALVGRRVGGTILGITFWRLCCVLRSDGFLFLCIMFPKVSALLQKPTGFSTLSSNLAKSPAEPSLR